MSEAIVCRHLVKTYPGNPPVEAVRGIDLTVHRGECFGVLGPNGAGKTTTIEVLEGLLEATAGEVEVLGLSWKKDEAAIRQQIGVSLQETRLSDRLTVIETLRLFRSFYPSGLAVRDVLSQVSLTEKSNSWVKNLSGGQKQRLAVACALVGNPEMLFLDEPTTGLDPTSRREMWEIVRNFRSNHRTVLLTTHYMEEAERLCDRVAIFESGKVIAVGTPRELIASLGAQHVIEFSRGVAADEQPVEPWILKLPTVERADRVNGITRLTVAQPHVVLPELIQALNAHDQSLSELTTRHASLEDVFVKLAGRQWEE